MEAAWWQWDLPESKSKALRVLFLSWEEGAIAAADRRLRGIKTRVLLPTMSRWQQLLQAQQSQEKEEPRQLSMQMQMQLQVRKKLQVRV